MADDLPVDLRAAVDSIRESLDSADAASLGDDDAIPADIKWP